LVIFNVLLGVDALPFGNDAGQATQLSVIISTWSNSHPQTTGRCQIKPGFLL